MIGLKQIFTWWNQKTIGTYLKTLFFGKLVGEDEFGNKYYKSKKNKRWVIYAKDIDASKITSDWFLWIHHTINEIPSSNTITGGFLIFMSIVYYSMIMKDNKRFIGLN